MAESHEPESATEDENKRRFREALERKTAKSAGGSARAEGAGKQARSHGAAGNHREFRRKSG